MAEFPGSPISPQEFFEGFIPEAFAEAELPDEIADLDFELGVQLEGEGGGQWLLHLSAGSFSVRPGSRRDAAVTLLQSVEDWRRALWEGRGGSIGRGLASFLFRPGAGREADSSPLRWPELLEKMKTLKGSLQVVVSGGEDGDWSLTLVLGPGEVPARPTTTLTLSGADSDAIEKGELDPVRALTSGRIQIGGDMRLLLQLQAVSLQAGGP